MELVHDFIEHIRIIGVFGGLLVPGIQQLMDLASLTDPNASTFERTMGGIGLGTDAIGLGAVVPPYRLFNRIDDLADVESAARSAIRVRKSVRCFGHCEAFADALIAALRRKGIHGTRITFKMPHHWQTMGNIIGDGQLVGSGVHDGVRVGDTVFDNLNPRGVPYEEWRDSIRIINDPALRGRLPDHLVTETFF
ncbi:MAG: papain fold toxin domain-containing protein [Myxococcota bacterium]